MKRDKKHCFSCGTAESIGLGKCKCGCHTEGKCPHNLARKYCTECRDKYCVVCAVKQLEKKITGSPIYYSPADYLNALEKLTRKRKGRCSICKQLFNSHCEGCCADVEAGVHTGKFCGAAGNEVAKE